MNHSSSPFAFSHVSTAAALLCLSFTAPALAETAKETGLDDFELEDVAEPALDEVANARPSAASSRQQPQQQQRPEVGARSAGGPPFKPVFDETWATVGIGAGFVPSYSGSNDYVVFPLPLIVGRVGGVGITPNGPGFNLDLLSKGTSRTLSETTFSFGPSFRFRNDRAQQVEDPVVELATELDTSIELGVNGGVSFAGVLHSRDRLGLTTQVRWDILDAHNGMLIEPGVTYFTPLGRGVALQLAANASFVDDDFADYYYTVTPADSAATGLPQFTADGGLNSLGTLAIVTLDLDNNVLNGGFNIYGVAGYSRLVGDAADTPFTAQRGSADQFIAGLGVGYTF